MGNIAFGYRLAPDGKHVELDPGEQTVLTDIRSASRVRRLIAQNRGHAKRAITHNAPGHGMAARTRGTNLCAELTIETSCPKSRTRSSIPGGISHFGVADGTREC